MHRIRRALRIRPGEGRTVGLVLALMVLGWAGAAVGSTGVESLFFARFGPRNLPWMYMALGVVTFPTTLAVAAALGRFDRRRALVGLALVLAAGACFVRVLLAVPAGWVFPATWLSMMVLWIVQGTFSWGVAGMVHDTRQAKRLFPLYGAGLILGGAIGGLSTGPLAAWLHAENLVLVWAGSLVAAYLLARAATGRRGTRRSRGLTGRRAPETGLLEGLRDGARFIRRSPLLRWMSAAMVLLALLSFAVSLPFAKAVTARFADADRLAAFLGVFQGVTYGVALTLSLLVANRLFARVGVATVVLTFPVLYAVGFVAVAASAGTFGPLVGFRFAQLAWMYGAWQVGWQALFNVVPPEHRDRARAFMDGAAMQAGIVLAGAVLLLAQELLTPRQLFLVAAAFAVLATFAAAGARRAYAGAVADALRAGWPEVFVAEEEPFGGIAWDRGALAALERGARDPDPGTRRVAMEMLAGVSLPEARPLRLAGLSDVDPGVRAAAVAVVARFPDPAALPRALELLSDPDPAVRAAAVAAASACAGAPRDVAGPLRGLLEDPDAHVRVRAAVTLHGAGEAGAALEALRASAVSPQPEERAEAVRALGALHDEVATVTGAVADQDPAVRRAAAEAMGGFGPGPADEALFEALADDDPTVREAAATTLAGRGPSAAARLSSLLSDERRADAALLALARGEVTDPGPIKRHAVDQRDAALRYHSAWRALAAMDEPAAALLGYAVRAKALAHAGRALVAEAALGDRAAVEMALQSLTSHDPGQRANALEMIEAVADAEVVRPLAGVWDPEPDAAGDGLAAARRMLEDADPWIRACAAQALSRGDGALHAALAAVAERDPDRLVRDTAARALRGEDTMRTLTTLSLMERMMALRQVPLFRELAPGDLRRVAEAAVEHLYPHGTLLAEFGEPGDAMHVVVTGEVRVVAQERGGPAEIARRGPGYIVGEMAILSDQPRMASLVAEGDVRTLSLDRARFQRILRDRPDAGLAVMRELCARLREAHAASPAAS